MLGLKKGPELPPERQIPEGYAIRRAVIDGSNVLHTQPGGNQANALMQVVRRLQAWGAQVTVVLPQYLLHKDSRFGSCEIFKELADDNLVIAVPMNTPPLGGITVYSQGPKSPDTTKISPSQPYVAIKELFNLESHPREIPVNVARDIVSLFVRKGAKHTTGAGRRQLSLDDLVVVYLARHLEAVIITCDKYTDLLKYDPSMRPVTRRRLWIHVDPETKAMSVWTEDEIPSKALHESALFQKIHEVTYERETEVQDFDPSCIAIWQS